MSGTGDLAERRARLTPEQRAELARRLRERNARAVPEQSIPRCALPDSVPLSYAQSRQWFLWQLDPSSTAYHLSGTLCLSGRLDVEAWRRGFDGLVARHESLRTVFRAGKDGLGEQVIKAELKLDIPLIDLRAVAAEEREACARDEIRRICDVPFDLARGPLLRVALIKLSDDQHILVVVMHHIISDGASMWILIDELAARCLAHMQGEALHLPELPIRYADYALWQRQWLEAGEKERQLAYWRQQLGDEHPVLALPTDHPRQAAANYRIARYAFDLPAGLTAELRRSAQASGSTLFMVLLAGFQALLHRHTGQEDIRVGVPIANRHRVETERIIGFFVNTQVLRNRIDGRTSLKTVLDQARDAALGAQAHQDLPFEQLVEAMQPERSLSHNPLFQVVYNHLREDYRALEQLPGLTLSDRELSDQAAQFELALDTLEQPDGQVRARLSYAAELFKRDTIERLAGHYLTLLEALADRPECAVADVELLSNAEQEQLNAWARNDQHYPAAQPVHRLIERQAEQRPETVALVFGETELSYAELNRRVNRLAHRLIALGVTPETRVGLAVERSLEMVVGLLAILKAGGAYVPLDPDYPSERLAYMIEDSGIELLLTQRHWQETLMPILHSKSHLVGRNKRQHFRQNAAMPGTASPYPGLPSTDLPVLVLDTLDLSQEPDHNPAVPLHGEHLAYVIYTSGSTGRPKGAANRHRSLYNRLIWMQEAYGLTGDDTVLQKTPFSFDVSVWEFFWPLMTGARLAIARPGDHRDPERLVELIQRHSVTTIHFVPSMLQAFLAHGGIDVCTCLKRIVCSGEALPAELQNKVFQQLPWVSLYNLYGSTEAAIDVTHWTCRNDGTASVPIGRPIGNVQTHVLDPDLNAVPPGVAGELYLGGVGLARGYHNHAGLTAERFIADPLDNHGGRLYRTGDLVRWRADGQLEYLGRIDHQVKIRGFRVELGEVEAQLLAQSHVREAVVVAQASSSGTRLVAYVSPAAGTSLDSTLLRNALGKALPDYMVPSIIVVLPALPLTPNGKVDRKALPAPDFTNTHRYEAPQGEVEEALAAIWAEVLEVERVGRQDSFFDLGGHSLAAIRITALLLQRYGWNVPVRHFFEHHTLSALASVIPAGGVPRVRAKDERLTEMDRLLNEFEV